MTVETSDITARVDAAAPVPAEDTPAPLPAEVSVRLKRKASTVSTDADAVAAVRLVEETDCCDDEVKRAKVVDNDSSPLAECVANAAEELCAEDTDASIYPDTEEFFAWHVSGSEAGAFLACHRLQSMAAAFPACKKLVEMGVTSVYDPVDEEDADESENKPSKENITSTNEECGATECLAEKCDEQACNDKEIDNKPEDDEVEDLKEIVNYAIEDSYCIVLQDAASDVDATPSELRKTLNVSAENNKWVKLRVSREEEAGAVPITVSVFDARKGLVIPKIGCWKWLTEVCEAEGEVDADLKTIMEKFC
ncbi:hypothetical protein HDU83_008209 [Entophlyctis luteolus]|nr:hypothetical protein HDU83_008209 [Entophlyctis luteolus]